MKFTGTKDYVATDDLKIAVNASIVLERPLLIKGEPGTGKTVLAEEIAKALGAPLITWSIKSSTKAAQGLYEYDAVARLRDAFLRRCFFHYISFPDRATMERIVDVHFPGIQKILVGKALEIFYDVR